MSERPTPETNAEAITPSGFEDDEVSAEFARKLERERDEAREKAERYRIEANAMMMQRYEARDQSQRLRVQLNHYTQANEMAEQAFSERNKAHKIAEQAIDDLEWFNETNAQRLRNELEQLKDEKN